TTPTTESTIPTIDSLVGTWDLQTCDALRGGNTHTTTREMEITKTGPTTATFIMTATSVDKDSAGAVVDTWYMGQKGTFSLTTEGILTKSVLEIYDSRDPLTASSTWDDGEGMTQVYPIGFINSILYDGVYYRQGSGTGLTGTWKLLIHEGDDYYEEFTRGTITLTSDTITQLSEESDDGTTWTVTASFGPAPCTVTTTFLQITSSGATQEILYYQQGNCLFLPRTGETSTTNFGWVKR
ncbi:MAG TPA: hypothetical protein PKH81_07440, partial [Treponemataceae bacterium]|nr:hypothetical protein [Treponemataceae bacterium]